MPLPDPDKAMPDPLETPDLQTLLCFNVYATGHSFNRFYQPILEPLQGNRVWPRRLLTA